MNFDLQSVREASLAKARELGYPINPNLPLLEIRGFKQLEEIRSRMLCLCATLAVAYGFPSHLAIAWLKQEKLIEQLAEREKELLEGNSDPTFFQNQVDSIFSLAWATSLVDELRFDKDTPGDLVGLFPDIRISAPSSAFAKELVLRPWADIVRSVDLAYCLHWAIRDALFRRKRAPGKLHPDSVIERRRGLEWLISGDSWDLVELNT